MCSKIWDVGTINYCDNNDGEPGKIEIWYKTIYG